MLVEVVTVLHKDLSSSLPYILPTYLEAHSYFSVNSLCPYLGVMGLDTLTHWHGWNWAPFSLTRN